MQKLNFAIKAGKDRDPLSFHLELLCLGYVVLGTGHRGSRVLGRD